MFDPAKYYVTYTIEHHPEGLTKEEVEALGRSATHALFAASILYPSDGSLSTYFLSVDGRQPQRGPLSDVEWFKTWSMLTLRLAKSQELDDEQHALVAHAVVALRRMMESRRKAREEEA